MPSALHELFVNMVQWLWRTVKEGWWRVGLFFVLTKERLNFVPQYSWAIIAPLFKCFSEKYLIVYFHM